MDIPSGQTLLNPYPHIMAHVEKSDSVIKCELGLIGR
jgi:hypothetical protein